MMAVSEGVAIHDDCCDVQRLRFSLILARVSQQLPRSQLCSPLTGCDEDCNIIQEGLSNSVRLPKPDSRYR